MGCFDFSVYPVICWSLSQTRYLFKLRVSINSKMSNLGIFLPSPPQVKYISLIFISIYAYLFANSARRISKALSQAKSALLNQKKISEILAISDDITTMTLKEYEIYIADYTKKSKYPDISQ